MKRREFLKGVGAAAVATAASSSRVMGANERIRLGIIGPGSRGQELMRDALKVPNTEFVAVADAFSLRQQQALRIAPTATASFDYRELLDRKDLDAVFVATPLHLHAEHFLATLAAGKDLYCEKTMTWSIEQARKVRNAAGKTDRVIGVGLQHVSGGAFADVKEFLTPGNMGKITKLRCWLNRNTRHGEPQWHRKPPAELTAENVRWDLFLGRNGNGSKKKPPFDAHRFYNWRFFWDYSGGNVTENMVHQMAFWQKAMNLGIPQAATMTGGVYLWKDGREVPDTIDVTLEFPDMTLVWNAGFGNAHDPFGDEVLGTDGTIIKNRHGVRYYPEKINRSDAGEQSGGSQGVNHIANWLECLRTPQEPNASVELGFRSAVTCHMANKAYREKRRVVWDAAREAAV